MIRRVAYKKAVFSGACGAIVWEILYRFLFLIFGFSAFDIVQTLGTMFFESPVSASFWWPVGMTLHVTVGAIWAVFYGYFFWTLFNVTPPLQGALFSLIPALGAGLVVIPQMSFLHPLILSGQMNEPGVFALNYGELGLVSVLLLHLVYGLVMGAIYQRPVGYAVAREQKKTVLPKNFYVTRPKAPPIQKPYSKEEFMFCTGIECSYPQVENGRWRMDELHATRHYELWERDLELVAELGIRYLRYGPPIHLISQGPGKYDWSFMDAAAEKMRMLGIVPIIDLCHFGLPHWLGSFQNKELTFFLAEYGAQFAKRYPWIKHWNPVNEMFVTARESTLGGAWNEQIQTEEAFVRATCNIARASQLTIQSISEFCKDAVFITSESSEFFQPCCPDEKIVKIADFENQRRFIATDLLHAHPLRDDIKNYLYAHGIGELEYRAMMQTQVSKRIIMGLDYYEWNEKLINAGGQVESLGELFGWYVITKQYFERYQCPIMHTETNFPDASRGPNWLLRQWHNIQLVRQEGVPVVGFTWYSLLDQIDWDAGLRHPHGNVFPVGLFDLNREPRDVSDAFRQLLKLFGNEKIPKPVLERLAV